MARSLGRCWRPSGCGGDARRRIRTGSTSTSCRRRSRTGRLAAADWLGVPRDSLALVTNVTEAISTLLALARSAMPATRSSSVTTGTVRSGWRQRRGAPGPARCSGRPGCALDADDAAVVAAYSEQLSERTRLVVVDQITSPTARSMPVAEVVAAARRTDAMVVVDAAHGPGHLPVDIEAHRRGRVGGQSAQVGVRRAGHRGAVAGAGVARTGLAARARLVGHRPIPGLLRRARHG